MKLSLACAISPALVFLGCAGAEPAQDQEQNAITASAVTVLTAGAGASRFEARFGVHELPKRPRVIATRGTKSATLDCGISFALSDGSADPDSITVTCSERTSPSDYCDVSFRTKRSDRRASFSYDVICDSAGPLTARQRELFELFAGASPNVERTVAPRERAERLDTGLAVAEQGTEPLQDPFAFAAHVIAPASALIGASGQVALASEPPVGFAITWLHGHADLEKRSVSFDGGTRVSTPRRIDLSVYQVEVVAPDGSMLTASEIESALLERTSCIVGTTRVAGCLRR